MESKVLDLRYVGKAMKMARLASGLMQKDVADASSMSRSQCSRYESGRETPNLTTLARYLGVVNANFADLQIYMDTAAIAADTDKKEGVPTPTFLKPFVRDLILEIISEMIGGVRPTPEVSTGREMQSLSRQADVGRR